MLDKTEWEYALTKMPCPRCHTDAGILEKTEEARVESNDGRERLVGKVRCQRCGAIEEFCLTNRPNGSPTSEETIYIGENASV